jgi:Tfp pilus assembly protein PilF
MSNFQMDKGRMKFGKYSLSNLALAEVGATALFGVLTIVMGWSAYKDCRTFFAWGSALKAYSSNLDPSADLDTVISHRPEFVPAHELRAKIFVNSGDVNSARTECDTTQKLDPNNESATVTQGVILLKTYDKTKQEPLLNQAKALFASAGTSADAKVGLGHVLLRQGDLEGSWKSFEAALTTDPPCSIDGMTDLYIGQAAIQVKRGNPTAARESFEKAMFLAPSWDRGYANKAYLLARQMAETPAMDREKFKAASQVWTDFATQFGNLYNQNKEARAYFKDAFVTYMDAFGCLALRSLDVGAASGKLNLLRGLDPTSKRPTLNYLATLATVVYNKSLTIDEQRVYLTELFTVATGSFANHKDLGHRDKAVIYQLISVRYSIDGSDLNAGIRAAESAFEEYQSSGEEPHLGAMIFRVKAACWWKLKEYEAGAKKAQAAENAVKAAEESLRLEPQQQDLSDWLKAIKNK